MEWDVISLTNYKIAGGGCATIGTLILMPLMLRIFNISDITYGLIGYVAFVAYYLGCAFAADTLSMFLVALFLIPAEISMVTLRSSVSKCVTTSEIGSVMSVFAVLQAITRNIGQIVATQIYVATSQTFLGTFYVIAGSLFIINIAIYGWMYRDMKKRNFNLNKQATEDRPAGNASDITTA